MKRILVFLAIAFPWVASAQKVISLRLDGAINPVAASYIHRGIEKANHDSAICLLIHLNTPGGLLKSTRNIVSDIFESRVPVIVYVSPGGAHAGSAGVFITLAGDIAAMAPGTNIGAAHPVSMQGEMDTIMSSKATNDAAAFIRTIAEYRKRNLQWSEDAVRHSVSITASEALKKNIIDCIASSDADLLRQLEGKFFTRDSVQMPFHTSSALVENLNLGFSEKLLDIISDPDVAYVLLMIGILGILFEIFNPGIYFSGIAGVISLVLAFYSLNTLPVNYAGLALIVFGIILLVLELKIISHGVFAIGGIASLLIGSLMLIRPVSGFEVLRISRALIYSTVIVVSAFFLFVISMGIRAQVRKPVMGVESMRGEFAEVLDALEPTGKVLFKGEIWNAVSQSGIMFKGEKVRVKEVHNLQLIVEKVNP
jgi:membrane-bound serine protease (ClpP class)